MSPPEIICRYRIKGKCHAVDPPGELYCSTKCPRYEPDYVRAHKIAKVKRVKRKKS